MEEEAGESQECVAIYLFFIFINRSKSEVNECMQTHPLGWEREGRVQWKGGIAVARSWALAPWSSSHRAVKLPTG